MLYLFAVNHHTVFSFIEYQKCMTARQQLDGQFNENNLVKEVGESGQNSPVDRQIVGLGIG